MPRTPTDWEPPPDHNYGYRGNGDGKEVKSWLLGLFAVVLVAIGGGAGAWLMSLTSRVTAVEVAQANVMGKLDTILKYVEKR